MIETQPDLKTQLQLLATTPSTWEKEVYENLDMSMPETNTFLKSVCAMVRRHLPDHRQMTVSLIDPHALRRGMHDVECFARDIVEGFPNVLLSIHQLHNFEILLPSFHPGQSIGHFNLYAVLPLVLATRDRPWPLMHWDSCGTKRCMHARQAFLNNMYFDHVSC